MVNILHDFIDQMSPQERQEITASKAQDLMNAAYSRYIKVENYRDDSRGRGKLSGSHAGELAISDTQMRKEELAQIDQVLQEARKSLDSTGKIATSKDEIERFENSYDVLERAEIRMENLSQALKERVVEKPVVYVKNIVVGARILKSPINSNRL